MVFNHLKRNGVLGINRRIGEFILGFNPRKHYPTVDNKILTSEMAKEAGIPVPEIYAVYESVGQLKDVQDRLKHLEDFVAKPARGAMGNGILVINSVEWDASPKKLKLETARKSFLNLNDFKYHLSGIISGLYSLSDQPDQVILQQKLKVHPVFDTLSYSGIPDVRVIVFKGYPVMAMVRLPTKKLGGRGNLHQGAIGCGIDLKTGRIHHAIDGTKSITHHPDTQAALLGVEIPLWEQVLEMAAKTSEILKLGYVGIDIILDPIAGPMLLEMNARPGLSIQLANRKGLVPALEAINKITSPDSHYQQRVEIAKSLF